MRPPITASAIGCRNSAPSPIPSAVGNMPAAIATVVMTIGRARSRQALRSASVIGVPARSSSMANSTSRMEFFAHSPSSISRPIIAGRSNVLPNRTSAAKAPSSDSGSAARMTAGLKKPLNSSTSTEKVSPMPATIASMKPPNSSDIASESPTFACWTPLGRSRMTGSAFTSCNAWPNVRPATRSASTDTRRSRS